MPNKLCSRRHLLHTSALGLGGIAASWLFQRDGVLAAESTAPVKPELEPHRFDVLPKRSHHPPKARAMISMFMLGGPSQIDLFDPKPELIKRNGEAFSGDVKFDNPAQASREIMGPAWRFRRYGKCGMELSDLVPHLGEVADDITLIRSMHSGANNHFPATMALYTGAAVGGRAPLGSWLLYGLGCESERLPAFVAMIDPKGPPIRGSLEWLSGDLPAIFQGTQIRPSEPRIFNLDPPRHLRGPVQQGQLKFLRQFNQEHLHQRPGEHDLSARMASYELAAKMQLSAREAFDVSGETEATLRMYGINEDVTRNYGTRCLIARRLVERGVRFVEIFANGQTWDHHSAILTRLPALCREVDRPAAALVKDLKQRGLLDSTLVHWGGEMGRLPVIQCPYGPQQRASVGRDHNTYGFSMWVAGGGLRGGYVHGRTDDFSHHAVEGVVHHYDWLATVLHQFGLDHKQLKFKSGPREVSLVDNNAAEVQHELLA